MTLESFSAWATWAAGAWDRGEHYELSIVAPDETFLGSVGLGVEAASKSANLQYWVRTTGTGRGVASEAAWSELLFASTHSMATTSASPTCPGRSPKATCSSSAARSRSFPCESSTS
jgi:hypothetical protein